MLIDIAMGKGSDDLLNESFAGGRANIGSMGKVWRDIWHVGPADRREDEDWKKERLTYWESKTRKS